MAKIEAESVVLAQHVKSKPNTHVDLKTWSGADRKRRRTPRASDVGKHHETGPDGTDPNRSDLQGRAIAARPSSSWMITYCVPS